MLASTLRGCAVLAFLLQFAAPSGIAQIIAPIGFVYSINSNSFETIQYPGAARGTWLTGINDSGDIVGNFFKDQFSSGFVRSGGTFTQINYPGAYYTNLDDINNLGQITGIRGLSINMPDGRAFLANAGSFTSFDYPGARFTYGNGINDAGTIVGNYRVTVPQPGGGERDFDTGLLINGSTLSPFSFPGAQNTAGGDINNSGQIVGDYYDGAWHGFLKVGDVFTSINYPGAVRTSASGINDHGHIIGTYTGSNGARHAFLMDGNSFTSFDFPSPTGTNLTIFSGINNNGQIVGYYYPLPAVYAPDGGCTALMLGLGAILLAGSGKFLPPAYTDN